MSEYFDSDEVTKDFDSGIFRRLMRYLLPHKATVAAALVALAVGTAAELVIPVLVRDTVDGFVIASRARARLGSEPAARLARRGGTELGEWVYFPEAATGDSTAEERARWYGDGSLDPGKWYVGSLARLGDEGRTALARIAGAESGDDGFAIPLETMRALKGEDARALRKGDLDAIAGNAIAFVAALVAALVATFAQVMLASQVTQRVMKALRVELYSKTLGQSTAFLSRHPVGRLVTRITGDVDTLDQFFTEVVASFLKDVALMAGVLATLLALDASLALVAIATLPPVAIATAVSRKKARDAFRAQRKSVSRVNAYLAERVAGVSVVQLFAREDDCAREFAARNDELTRASLGEMYVFATFRPVVDLFAWTTIAVVLWAGAAAVGANALSLGTLIAFVNLARMFYSPVLDISEKYTMLQSAMAGGERVFRLLDTEETIPDRGSAKLPRHVRGELVFDSVSFGYVEGEPVLRDLSFRVEPGERVAIVGTTGAGKTTIANLVARLWDVDSGRILVDGTDIRDVPLGDLRRAIQPVPQEVFLFSGTVRENIDLGTGLTDGDVERAARTVSAHEFVAALPDGYDTALSEGATNLSAGQRQLLSFARVVAHDPGVVILDEATSSIDTETERLVQRGLEGMLAGRTSIAIAHRLSTIRNADRIIVLAHGRVAEEGSHDSLIAAGGIYYELYRLQYGGQR